MKMTYSAIILVVALLILVGGMRMLCPFSRSIQLTSPGERSLGDVVLLRCVIPNEMDEGGFAWHLHHVQCGLHLARLTGKQLVVKYTRGYYHDPSVGPNWWEYFFEPFHDPRLDAPIAEAIAQHRLQPITRIPLPPARNRVHLYTNSTFQNLLRPLYIDWSDMYTKIRLKPAMERKIQDFVEAHFPSPRMVGVHYRGTDKFPNHGMQEDLHSLRHAPYEQVLDAVGNFLQAQSHPETWGVFVASDEEDFIQVAKARLPRVVAYASTRSTFNSSGLDIGDTTACWAGNTSAVCEKYHDIVRTHSIHRGMKHVSPYKKGEDAIMDMWLLSRCNAMFRNTAGGNFSSQPTRINPRLRLFSLQKDGTFN